MNKQSKSIRSNLLFATFVVIYLFVRNWPFGGMLQTIADILILVAIALTIAVRIGSKKR